ncbi:MAG: hypothetical protein Q7U97_17540 [Rhodocyclaceae bacterium]|nr:hypothetical protein [Rhodocyclaceae bacterium]
MTRRHKRVPRPARCPVMVAMHLAPEVGITERIAVDAIAGGWAQTCHFNVLADCHDLLALAADYKDDKQTLAIVELSGIALLNMMDRFGRRGVIGASGEELKALRVLVNVSEDFWNRQSGELFRAANEELDRSRGFERRAAV